MGFIYHINNMAQREVERMMTKATIYLPEIKSLDDFRLIAFNGQGSPGHGRGVRGRRGRARDAILRKIRTGSSVLVRDIQVEYPRYEGLV